MGSDINEIGISFPETISCFHHRVGISFSTRGGSVSCCEGGERGCEYVFRECVILSTLFSPCLRPCIPGTITCQICADFEDVPLLPETTIQGSSNQAALNSPISFCSVRDQKKEHNYNIVKPYDRTIVSKSFPKRMRLP